MDTGWDGVGRVDERSPVIVGVGVASPPPADPERAADAFDLMVTAARRAAADAGRSELLAAVDVVSVPMGSWSRRNPGGYVATAIGASHARSVLLEAGIPQQTLFNDAHRQILGGEIQVALIVGGESARTAARARRAGLDLVEPDGVGEPDERRAPAGEIVSDLEISTGMWTPVQQFALIDSALRHAEGASIEGHRDEVARLWAGFNRVAAQFDHAAFPEALTESFIRQPSDENRAMSFPYNKWHCSQMRVDQAAAILVTSLGAARSAGIDESRLVFPLLALESSTGIAVVRRKDLHRWPAMRVLADAAIEHLGGELDQIDHSELYSCFPAAVRVQQRELGLPVDGLPTITGGASFAGGPWNNFVLQATAAMVERTRAEPGSTGMVTTVSGFLHKPGIAVYSTEPDERGLLVSDLGAEAEAATETLPLATDHRGPATVAAVTVAFERDGEQRVVAILDTPAGERWLAFSDDPSVADRAMSEELIGTGVDVDGSSFALDSDAP